jgi:hypothetical protein
VTNSELGGHNGTQEDRWRARTGAFTYDLLRACDTRPIASHPLFTRFFLALVIAPSETASIISLPHAQMEFGCYRDCWVFHSSHSEALSGFAPRFIELNDSLPIFLDKSLGGDRSGCFALFDASVTAEQQGLGLSFGYGFTFALGVALIRFFFVS